MLLLRKHSLCMLPPLLGGTVKNIQQLVVIVRHLYIFLLKTGKHSLASLEISASSLSIICWRSAFPLKLHKAGLNRPALSPPLTKGIVHEYTKNARSMITYKMQAL